MGLESNSQMRAILVRIIPFVIASALLAGCSARPPASVSVPHPNSDTDKFISRGDALLLGSHLHDWRQAESVYAEAYRLWKTDEIRHKLALTRFLILTREIELDISNPARNETIGMLCTDLKTERDKALCGIALWYKGGAAAGSRDEQAVAVNGRIADTTFDRHNSPLDAYLYLLFSRAYGLGDPPPGWEEVSGKFKESPLFIYLDLGRRGLRGADELRQSFPSFAEMFEFLGEVLFQKRQYGAARRDFRKAVELIPDFTRALNGIGNIYLFALEDFEKALEYYESTLRVDPENVAALFGKGAVLHQLDRYQESITVLDTMQQIDLSRKGHLDASGVRYYRGEGCYLKAHDYYLMKEPGKAREFVDRAKTFLPDSEDINYLSGLLYFEAGDREAARGDFLRVMEQGTSNAAAQYYLGLIYHERKGRLEEQHVGTPRIPRGESYDSLMKHLSQLPAEKEPAEKMALNYFLGACSSMARIMRSLNDQIDSVSALDIEAEEKVVLKGRLGKKLYEHRLLSTQRIETMIRVVSGDDIPAGQNYVNLMSEILAGIRP